MDRRRSASMDVSVSIPAAVAAMDNFSEESIAIIIPPRPTALPKSSPNKTQPLPMLGLQINETTPHPSPTSFATKVIKKVVAELLGTFLLVFTVLSALIMNERHGGALGLLGVAVAAGLAMLVIVASLGHVSGGHLNPAVSVAMAVFGHLPRSHLAPYVAAQFLGAIAASFAAKALYDPAISVVVATVPSIGAGAAFVVEFITTFVFLFVVTALATDPKAVKELVAVGAGTAVVMNALISADSTGASMNPARTLGAAIATGTYTKIWVYMAAPPLGAIAGSGAYHALKLK